MLPLTAPDLLPAARLIRDLRRLSTNVSVVGGGVVLGQSGDELRVSATDCALCNFIRPSEGDLLRLLDPARELSFRERVASGHVPPGTDPAAWRERLLARADATRDPRHARRLWTWAKRIVLPELGEVDPWSAVLVVVAAGAPKGLAADTARAALMVMDSLWPALVPSLGFVRAVRAAWRATMNQIAGASDPGTLPADGA